MVMGMREMLVELIEKTGMVENKNRCNIIAEELIANGVTIQRWIPVTERLPEIGGYYLVHQMNPRYKTSFIQHARYSENQEKWLGALALCSLDFVTHWMPLPEPPEEGE